MGLSCGALVNARRFLLRNDADLEVRAHSLPQLRNKVTPYQTCALKKDKNNKQKHFEKRAKFFLTRMKT